MASKPWNRLGCRSLFSMGHCNGLMHPDDDQDEWVEITDADRAGIAAIARRQWLQIKGPTAPARTAERRAPPKARRDIARGGRNLTGEGY